LTDQIISIFRKGKFVDPSRVKSFSIVCLIISVIGFLGLLVTSSNNLAFDGQPIGTDFSNVYAAGKMVLQGRIAEIWDWQAHFQVQRDLFGKELTGFYGWHYPPMFLMIAALVAFLPYAFALFVWQAASFSIYFLAVKAIVGHHKGWLLPVIGFPAIYVNVTHGHNGFLTAGLFGLAFLFLDRRPIIAGIMIGCLAYKPQFGVLIPFVLLAGRYYQTFLSASFTVAVLALVSTLLFGMEVWPAFIESMQITREIILEEGNTGWFKIQSGFSAVMLWTGSLGLAYLFQTLLMLGILAVCVLAFVSRAAIEDRAALVIIGSLLATPYVLDYDLMALAPAIAFLAARGINKGFRDFELALLGLVWLVPLFARIVMQHTAIPLGFVLMLCLFGVVAREVVANYLVARNLATRSTPATASHP